MWNDLVWFCLFYTFNNPNLAKALKQTINQSKWQTKLLVQRHTQLIRSMQSQVQTAPWQQLGKCTYKHTTTLSAPGDKKYPIFCTWVKRPKPVESNLVQPTKERWPCTNKKIIHHQIPTDRCIGFAAISADWVPTLGWNEHLLFHQIARCCYWLKWSIFFLLSKSTIHRAMHIHCIAGEIKHKCNKALAWLVSIVRNWPITLPLGQLPQLWWVWCGWVLFFWAE